VSHGLSEVGGDMGQEETCLCGQVWQACGGQSTGSVGTPSVPVGPL